MIVFEGVTKIYEPDVVAVRDVTFHIDKGEFVFIVGPSGSGKSTLGRLLSGINGPRTGSVRKDRVGRSRWERSATRRSASSTRSGRAPSASLPSAIA
jgi:cell division transport system ATP-binding protein